MHQPFNNKSQLRQQVEILLIVVPVSVAIGTAVACFLWLLNLATHFRFVHPWLLYLLPPGGVVIYFAYQLFGKSSEKGNNLIIDHIHRPGAGIPKRMGPFILFTTVITHLFGGSAGREGTAVQIGGSMAAMFAGWFKLNQVQTTALLTAGVAAGFGAVFGTPLTGAVFAVEVLTIGKMDARNIIPCLVAGFTGDITLSFWGIKHTVYVIDSVYTPQTTAVADIIFYSWLVIKIMLAASLFGIVSLVFTKLAHSITKTFNRIFKSGWLIPVFGGFIIIAITLALGKPDYLGLGVEPQYPGADTIVSAFQNGGAHLFSWFWKLLYTAITLGTGFKGGEVTPLFYIGATLGNTLATLMDAPLSLFAALGFIGVFSGATNTPVACTLMGVELFGPQYTVFFMIACFVSYLLSGHTSIYAAQRNDFGTDMNPRYRYIRQKISKYKLW